jgi:hypothetical protein
MYTVTGKFLNPDSTPVAGGTLVLSLGDLMLSIALDADGNIPSTAVAAGTYTARVIDSSGDLVYGPEDWVITTDFNASAFTPPLSSTKTLCSYKD